MSSRAGMSKASEKDLRQVLKREIEYLTEDVPEFASILEKVKREFKVDITTHTHTHIEPHIVYCCQALCRSYVILWGYHCGVYIFRVRKEPAL